MPHGNSTNSNQALLARLRSLFDATLLPLATSLGTTPASLRAGLGAAALVLALHAALGRAGTRLGGVDRGGEGAAGGGDVSRGGDAAAREGSGPSGGRAHGPAGGASVGRKAGVLRVSIATPGLLVTSQGGSADVAVASSSLDEKGTAAVARLVAAGCDVYLITQLQATTTLHTQRIAAVDACLPAAQRHRSLVCSTQAGRIALVRQLGADCHLDAAADVAAELGRLRVPCVHVTAGAAGLSDWVEGHLAEWT